MHSLYPHPPEKHEVQKNGVSMNLAETIQYNCNISDARDQGIYSMCTMVLKLRNLYKWEYGLEPWAEPEPADLLDWIDQKENHWATIAKEPFKYVVSNGREFSADDPDGINKALENTNRFYGYGFGHSMKTIFFLAEKIDEYRVANCPVIILGKEEAREMASPFAMAQDGIVYIRRENLRYFLWDHFQELRSTCRTGFHHTLDLLGLSKKGVLSQELLRHNLDSIVDTEMDLFVRHEIGEILQTTLDSETLHKIVTAFPASVIELVCRSVKDILADTDDEGVLGYLIKERRSASLSLYVGMLDGMRRELFGEIFEAVDNFHKEPNWKKIEQARAACREKNLQLARTIREIAENIGHKPDHHVRDLMHSKVVAPLGLDVPS